MSVKQCSIAALCCLTLCATGCKQQKTTVAQPISVRVWKATASPCGDTQELSGTIEASSGSTLSFAVAGTVQLMRVDAGQRVEKGQLIAVIDEATLRNSHEAAVALLAQAEDAYQRMKLLHDAGSLPEIQWVEAQSKLKQAQSAEAIARKNLSDSHLYAPFSGVIAERLVDIGGNVLPGQPVVRLVKTSQVKVCASVPENEIARIRRGQQVVVTVPALNGKTLTGRITEIGVEAQPLSRSYQVKALIGNASGELMPGMICTMSIGNGKPQSAIVLPTSVISRDEDNRTFVWVNRLGKACKQQIQTGALTRDGVIVVSGLTVGSEVIVEGQQKVSQGMNITVK